MKIYTDATKNVSSRPIALKIMLCLAMLVPVNAFANHTVLVEGEQDYDGDGLLGIQEDTDGDQVFGTLTAAVNGVSHNGRVMIVTSGRFFEQVVLQGVGVSVLEAAPGVNAVVEAFQGGGDKDQNNVRRMQPGIIVDSDGSYPIEIRNIISRNWTEGVQVKNNSRVTLDNLKVDSNVNYGIHVMENARVAITNSQVNSSGYRKSGTLGATPWGDIVPAPGTGIAFEGNTYGTISNTTVSHSFGIGIENSKRVTLLNNTVFDNNPDFPKRDHRYYK